MTTRPRRLHPCGRKPSAAGREAGPFDGKAVWDVTWVLMAWSILATGLIVWLADAQDLLEGRGGQGRDRTSCACCRHDRIAHDPDRPDGACTQCPCESYRPLA